MKRTIIVGHGEIGQALEKVLAEYKPEIIDPDKGLHSMSMSCDVMHICFPYSEEFIDQVEEYKLNHVPTHLVIHSTVPIGTSAELGAIHSPVRGLHPDLEGGLRTFVKFIGGPNASAVADYFRRAGLRVMLFDKAETTEAMKLFDTEYYRACIEFALRVKKLCGEQDLSFHEVYTLANQTYNEAYSLLGHPEFVRPVLQPIQQQIGGHCVLPNKELIKQTEI